MAIRKPALLSWGESRQYTSASTTQARGGKAKEQKPGKRIFQEQHDRLRALKDSPMLWETNLSCGTSWATQATVDDNGEKANFTSIREKTSSLTLRRQFEANS